MQIDLDRIKKELDAGRKVKLECISSSKLTSGGFATEWKKTLYRDELIVDYIHEDGEIVLRGQMVGLSFPPAIPENSFKYFRIKRSTPTFNDLIDVAVQGVKDNIIVINHFDIDAIAAVSLTNRKISFEEWRGRSSDKDIIDAINLIESLYTETFVIESEDHIEMVKLKASVKLTNGNEFIVDNATSEFLTSSTSFEKLTILTLKGATVTQNKARKEIL